MKVIVVFKRLLASGNDILTVVQKSYFFAKNRGVKTIFKLKTLPKKFKNPPYRY